MNRKCRICLVEFEPKTPQVPIVNASVHVGCYQAYTRAEEKKFTPAESMDEQIRRAISG